MDKRRGQAYHRRFSPLYTDYYEYSMTQGYYLSGKGQDQAVFDLFYRQNPYGGGYAIAAGLRDTVDYVLNMHFTSEELGYLSSLGYRDDFLQVLEKTRFTGDITAVPEGEVVFPGEPIISVKGPLIETQLLEGLILSTVNFQTLIATKARRMVSAAEGRSVYDFGLRRAQGDGGMGASRACFVGGVTSTSNVLLAFEEGVPVGGTMAHSWIQSFGWSWRRSVLTHRCIRMTPSCSSTPYDTLKQGLPNAVIVGQEAGGTGPPPLGRPAGPRRDLRTSRQRVRVGARRAWTQPRQDLGRNQLDEYVIVSLVDQGVPIDILRCRVRLRPVTATVHGTGALQDG